MLTINARCFVAALALSSLTACSWNYPLRQTEPVERLPLKVVVPQPITTLPIHWVIITKDNFAQVMEEQKKLNNSVFIALTPDGYKNIASNQAEVLSYILQQQAVIAAYKDYYVTPTTQEKTK